MLLVQEGMNTLMTRAEEIAREKLAADQKLQYMPEAIISRELMQELDRYPIVERAVSDLRALSNPTLASGIRASVKAILQRDRNGGLAIDAPRPPAGEVSSTPAIPQSASQAVPTATTATEDSVPHTPIVPAQTDTFPDEKTRAVRFEVDGINGHGEIEQDGSKALATDMSATPG